MTIALAGTPGGGNATADPRTLTYTVDAAANLLVAACMIPGAFDVVSVSYGAQSMTLLGDGQSGGVAQVHFAYLYNPTTGVANNVSFDLSGSASARLWAAGFSGADPAFLPDMREANGSGLTASVAITPSRPGGVIVFGTIHSDATPGGTSFGSGQTLIQENDDGSHSKASSYELNANEALNTQTWTTNTSTTWWASAAFFAPPASPRFPGVNFQDPAMLCERLRSGIYVAKKHLLVPKRPRVAFA